MLCISWKVSSRARGGSSGGWWSLPFLAMGMYQLRKTVRERREALPLLAVAGAFVFVLSSLKLPSVTGSCSHPTGTGLSAVLFGGFITSVLALIVLIYQALLLAHGGITTMGANVFSMGVAGPLVAWILYRVGKQVNLNTFVNVFIAAFVADLFTYLVTSLQLALAFPAAEGGLLSSFAAFTAIFAFTQVPLAVVEGVIVALTFKYIIDVRPDILVKLDVLTQNTLNRLKEAAA